MSVILISLIAIELLLRNSYKQLYPTYSYLLKNKRYIVDGKENDFSLIYSKSNYYAYKSKPNIDLVETDKYYNFTQRIKTNDEGFRFGIKDKFRKNIMVLGDSVTFGIGVNNGETYPDCLENILGNKYNVLNFGVGGWGFAEYYLTYKKYVRDVNPILIIMGVFPSNDFNDLFYSYWQGKKRENCLFLPSRGMMFSLMNLVICTAMILVIIFLFLEIWPHIFFSVK